MVIKRHKNSRQEGWDKELIRSVFSQIYCMASKKLLYLHELAKSLEFRNKQH